jgi:nitrous oxide reductase accessory protein NosL
MKLIWKRILFVALILVFSCLPTMAAAPAAVPSPRDKCPVCGMFVAKYPGWIAVIRFKDGTHAFFDGPKDLFTYNLNLRKYNPAKSPAAIAAVQVKDYYTLAVIDGRKAFYVSGSDVYGPMGKELIPFGKPEDAQEFARDHKGTRVLRFDQVTPAMMKGLE